MSEENTSLRELIPELIYHYTSLEKFKCIIQNGNLRFSLSTKSNDIVDTRYLIDLLKDTSIQIADSEAETNNLIAMLFEYFKRDDYQNNHKSFVACFSKIPDSRLLWDAYTVNRPSNEKCHHGENRYCNTALPKYNGICIAFKRDALYDMVKLAEQQNICENVLFAPIFYAPEQHISALDYIASQARDIYYELKDDPDQEQAIIPERTITLTPNLEYTYKLKKCFVSSFLTFINSMESFSPFFKHPFWGEENEYRLSLCMTTTNSKTNQFIKSNGFTEYIDLCITSECIDHIILGPEFSFEDKEALVNMGNTKIDYNGLKPIKSIGTGVIRYK